MFHLVTQVTVHNIGGTPVAKRVFGYDNYAAMGGLEFYNMPTNPFPPGHNSSYDQAKTDRGNLTSVKVFSDVANNVSTTRRMKYDIFGNVVKAEVSCCAVKTSVYGDNTGSATYYALPLSQTDGTPDVVPFLTTNYIYNFYTSLPTQITDPNGNSTQFTYDAALRPLSATSAAGATTTTKFDKDGNQLDQLAYSQKVEY
jgi:YD repeat-containing protein